METYDFATDCKVSSKSRDMEFSKSILKLSFSSGGMKMLMLISISFSGFLDVRSFGLDGTGGDFLALERVAEALCMLESDAVLPIEREDVLDTPALPTRFTMPPPLAARTISPVAPTTFPLSLSLARSLSFARSRCRFLRRAFWSTRSDTSRRRLKKWSASGLVAGASARSAFEECVRCGRIGRRTRAPFVAVTACESKASSAGVWLKRAGGVGDRGVRDEEAVFGLLNNASSWADAPCEACHSTKSPESSLCAASHGDSTGRICDPKLKSKDGSTSIMLV